MKRWHLRQKWKDEKVAKWKGAYQDFWKQEQRVRCSWIGKEFFCWTERRVVCLDSNGGRYLRRYWTHGLQSDYIVLSDSLKKNIAYPKNSGTSVLQGTDIIFFRTLKIILAFWRREWKEKTDKCGKTRKGSWYRSLRRWWVTLSYRDGCGIQVERLQINLDRIKSDSDRL